MDSFRPDSGLLKLSGQIISMPFSSGKYKRPTETLAIKRALGSSAKTVAISSTKSMTGHLIGASGGIETIATALMIENRTIHATINLENPGEGCDLFYVPKVPIQREISKAINNSFGFGGTNGSMILSKYQG